MENNMRLLKETVAVKGQAAVARELGYSASALNQVLKGTYNGSIDNFMARVADTYGQGTVSCPVMGEISIRRCALERKKPFGASSPQRARLLIACRDCMAHRR